MAMKRCNNGHFYDDTKHSVCPFCGVQNLDLSVTMPVRNPAGGAAPGAAPGMTQAKPAAPVVEKTVAKSRAAVNDGKTVGIMRNNLGFDPVVGWLVCVDGPEVGRDYRLRSEKNFIGRLASMDVSIAGDDSISRSNHAAVSFDPKNNTFKLYPGDGHGLVYLNGNELCAPENLKRGDVIELGKTTLVFVPFCGEGFKWQKN